MIEPLVTTWQEAARPERRVGHSLEVHASIGSTSDRVRELIELPGGAGIVVVAEEQSAGRGRMGRRWTSPPGRNLTASVGVVPRLDAADGWQLGLAAALAAYQACGSVASVELKWPNDIVAVDGRKLGGLLVETSTEGPRLRTAIIGVGINVNWHRAEMPEELAARATSLAELAGTAVDRVVLLRSVLDRLEAELDALESGQSPLARYRRACATLGADVTVETSDGLVEGRARDVDERGALVIETVDGPVAVSSGEVARVRRAADP